jgi:heptosyltransferase I
MAMAKIEPEPRKILIVLHGSIGDVTRALPLARLLKNGFPRASLAWSVEPAAYPLLVGNPWIDEIILFNRKQAWRNFAPFLAEIRARRFDLVLDLQRHLKSGIVSWASGARWRLGFHPHDSKEGNGFFNNLHIDRYGESISKLDHYLKFIDFLAIPRAPLEWDFSLTPSEWVAVERHLVKTSNGYAVLFIGTRWPSKQWFAKQIAESAHMLHAEHGLDVLLLGAAEDRGLASQAMAEAAFPVIDLVGKTTLREAVGIIQKAKLAIGPDTGLMHIAAAVGTPVISLWGATDPRRTGPFGFTDLIIRGEAPCVPCKRRQCPIGRVCMQSITKSMIDEKVMAVVQREPVGTVNHGSAF